MSVKEENSWKCLLNDKSHYQLSQTVHIGCVLLLTTWVMCTVEQLMAWVTVISHTVLLSALSDSDESYSASEWQWSVTQCLWVLWVTVISHTVPLSDSDQSHSASECSEWQWSVIQCLWVTVISHTVPLSALSDNDQSHSASGLTAAVRTSHQHTCALAHTHTCTRMCYITCIHSLHPLCRSGEESIYSINLQRCKSCSTVGFSATELCRSVMTFTLSDVQLLCYFSELCQSVMTCTPSDVQLLCYFSELYRSVMTFTPSDVQLLCCFSATKCYKLYSEFQSSWWWVFTVNF